MAPMISQNPITPDNSFKITIPSKNVRPAAMTSNTSSPASIMTLDRDGAPLHVDQDGAPIIPQASQQPQRPQMMPNTSVQMTRNNNPVSSISSIPKVSYQYENI